MRIGSSNINPYVANLKKQTNNNLPQDLFLDDKKSKEDKGNLEVRRENGYIRHYIVKSDGKTILISETKDVKNEDQKEISKSEKTSKGTEKNDSNAKDLMGLLNNSAGTDLNSLEYYTKMFRTLQGLKQHL
ncbi:hypothetical protein ACQKMD_18405 [Viridibacillus sp. NPDC096237]|uniref:hypothetical protein n=1 Tax=Viridibacillus sp. NPDC096237 TaxID=3390721 RepID=UPI003CFC42A4